MKKTKLFPEIHLFPPGIADLVTPVSIYLRIRDRFPNAILLESSDYHGNKNSMSYICFEMLSGIKVRQGNIEISFADGKEEVRRTEGSQNLSQIMDEYLKSFEIHHSGDAKAAEANGLFGYTSYDAVQYFESVEFKNEIREDCMIPEMSYAVYRFIISIDHFSNRIRLIENLQSEEKSRFEEVNTILSNRTTGIFNFRSLNNEQSNLTDQEYMNMVEKGIGHCHRGDVFQIVLSRQFRQNFKGDEFNVYRALRSINPSPYLFFFDYGSYKLFGSSPEAQIVIKGDEVRINPIAGTFKRTGNDERDRQLAIDLAQDPKENSEHVMLVDLARNDLSRNSDHVSVKTYREVQFYSHVIHLVSEISGQLKEGSNPVKIFGDSFPAGTLSGAPKFRAMELIDNYENRNRGFYGGAIGYIGFNGDFNHAIMIRSFLSKNNTLYYQAGAGIVAASVPTEELKEVNNKLGALKKAIEIAGMI